MTSLALIAALVLAQPWNPDDKEGRFYRFTSRTDQGRSDRGLLAGGFAFFEAFPANQAGSGGNCACASVTSAQGGALTMTRASTATCSKQGAATTGIQNGDLVTCAVDKPRVEAGTYLREATKTNIIVQSQAINDAAWTKGAAVGTITADFAVAPDGTTTADRYQYSNTTNDYVLQAFSVGGFAAVGSVYLKGTSGSGSIDLCRGGAGGQCVSCPYVSTSWSRCVYPGNLATSSNLFLGCETGTKGGACTGSGFDVLVWGFQGELGAFASSYIPTTAATVARSADSALTGTVTATGTDFSMAASVAFLLDGSGAPVIFQLGSAAPALASIGTNTNTAAAYTINATSTTPAVSAMGTSTWRTSLNDSSGTRTAFWAGGSVAAPAASMVGTATAITIGAPDSRTSLVCLDPTPGRCQ